MLQERGEHTKSGRLRAGSGHIIIEPVQWERAGLSAVMEAELWNGYWY